jgi:hypothetical protein
LSQLVAQKNLLGVGAFVGANDTDGDGVIFGTAVGATEGVSVNVCACGAVGASILPPSVMHWSGLTVKHALVALLHVAQLFVLSKQSVVASGKLAAQILYGAVVVAGVAAGVGAGVGSGQMVSSN